MLWTPTIELVSAISSMLRQTTSPRDSMLVDLLLHMGIGQSEPSSVEMYSYTSYLSRTGIRSLSSTPPQDITVHDPSPSADVKYNPVHLRLPHG